LENEVNLLRIEDCRQPQPARAGQSRAPSVWSLAHGAAIQRDVDLSLYAPQREPLKPAVAAAPEELSPVEHRLRPGDLDPGDRAVVRLTVPVGMNQDDRFPEGAFDPLDPHARPASPGLEFYHPARDDLKDLRHTQREQGENQDEQCPAQAMPPRRVRRGARGMGFRGQLAQGGRRG